MFDNPPFDTTISYKVSVAQDVTLISKLLGELIVVELMVPAHDGIDTVLVGVKLTPSKEKVVVDDGAMERPELVDIYGIISQLIPAVEIVIQDPVGVTVIHVHATTSD